MITVARETISSHDESAGDQPLTHETPLIRSTFEDHPGISTSIEGTDVPAMTNSST